MRVNLTAERLEIDYGHPEAERPRPPASIRRVSHNHAGSVSAVMSEALDELKYELVPEDADGEFIMPTMFRWVHVWTKWDQDRHLLCSWVLTADATLVTEGNVIQFPTQ